MMTLAELLEEYQKSISGMTSSIEKMGINEKLSEWQITEETSKSATLRNLSARKTLLGKEIAAIFETAESALRSEIDFLLAFRTDLLDFASKTRNKFYEKIVNARDLFGIELLQTENIMNERIINSYTDLAAMHMLIACITLKTVLAMTAAAFEAGKDPKNGHMTKTMEETAFSAIEFIPAIGSLSSIHAQIENCATAAYVFDGEGDEEECCEDIDGYLFKMEEDIAGMEESRDCMYNLMDKYTCRKKGIPQHEVQPQPQIQIQFQPVPQEQEPENNPDSIEY